MQNNTRNRGYGIEYYEKRLADSHTKQAVANKVFKRVQCGDYIEGTETIMKPNCKLYKYISTKGHVIYKSPIFMIIDVGNYRKTFSFQDLVDGTFKINKIKGVSVDAVS